jgi:hypothetical protein
MVLFLMYSEDHPEVTFIIINDQILNCANHTDCI